MTERTAVFLLALLVAVTVVVVLVVRNHDDKCPTLADPLLPGEAERLGLPERCIAQSTRGETPPRGLPLRPPTGK